jgi:tetratricopeptide (TPR) repeat protein
MNRFLNPERAVAEICRTGGNPSYFFMAGAGISRPPVPTAREMIAEWKDLANAAGLSLDDVSSQSTLDAYEAFFRAAYASNGARQEYLRSKMQDQLLPAANYKLAKILHHGRLTKIAVTTNFDTFLFRALGFLGSDPLLYDHPATSNARFESTRDEPQILHVHGTYLFYDCANLRAQIAGLANSMYDLLSRILSERSPIVVGYAGWQEDVFMTALRDRLYADLPHDRAFEPTRDRARRRQLRNNLYWFCYRQAELSALPEWLRDHSDVFFVVPEEKSESAENHATVTARNSTSLSASTETTLPAEEVFDRFIRRLQIEPSAIDKDPVTFFVSRLKNVLLGFTDANVAKISSIVKEMREGYQQLECIKSSLLERQYLQAASLGCELSEAIGTKYRDTTLAQELAELIWKVADHLPHESNEDVNHLVCAYTAVGKLGEWLYSQGVTTSSVRSYIARALTAVGTTYLENEDFDKALEYFDRVITAFSDERDPVVLDSLTSCKVDKGIALCRRDKPTENNECAQKILGLYDEVINRNQNATELVFRESVASAKVNKAYLLSEIGQEDHALNIYRDVIDQYAGDVEPAIREHVARAMINKAFGIGMKHDPNSTRAAVNLYKQVVEEFPCAWKPSMQAKLALAWNGLGFQSLLLAKWHLQNGLDASETLDQALSAIKKAEDLDPNGWLMLGNEAYILFLQGRRDEARERLNQALELGGEEARLVELSDTTVYPLDTDSEFKSWLNKGVAAAHP